jgi:hypothetical protein
MCLLTVRIPKTTRDELIRIATDEQVPCSFVVRMAIDELVKKYKQEQEHP